MDAAPAAETPEHDAGRVPLRAPLPAGTPLPLALVRLLAVADSGGVRGRQFSSSI